MSDVLAHYVAGLADATTSPIFAISVAFSILAVAVYHWGIARPALRSSRLGSPVTAAPALEAAADLNDRVEALEAASARNLQHVGFVRFNAFADVGSDLSYALAVADGNGDGFLLTSIYSREEVRTYAKAIRKFGTGKEVSNEERQALDLVKQQARTGQT